MPYFFIFMIMANLLFAENDKEKLLNEDTERTRAISLQVAKFYDFAPGQDIREITSELLSSPLTPANKKEEIQKTKRRFFIFQYPSDKLKVKGFISFLPEAASQPTLIFLRGGNRMFGLSNPALLLPNQMTVIGTLYRGGVSEGEDQFGGDDVNDVKNLIAFLPTLQKKLNIQFDDKQLFFYGRSRGGMELFLALARFPELQQKAKKIVVLTGILDLPAHLASRSDARNKMFEDFGMLPEQSDEWLKKRNPIETVSRIRKDLPILIIQGTADIRVSLEQGRHMVKVLKESGHNVTYWEIEGADHSLNNHDNGTEMIVNWLKA